MTRIGLIGVGRWGTKLLRRLLALAGPELDLEVAVAADVDPAARARAAELGCPQVVTSMAELVSEVDAVIVATPPRFHYEHAKAALLAGRHVLVEKPLATTVAHARELVALAEATERTLMVGHILLFAESIRWVKRYVDSGEAGPIRHAFFQRINTGRVRRSVDAMWNLAPHDMAIADYWFGRAPERVHAVGRSVLDSGHDDASLIRLRYPCGGSACIVVSWLSGVLERRASVVTDRCVIECDELAEDPIVIYRDGHRWAPELDAREPLRAEIEHFLGCIRAQEQPVASGVGGLRVVSTLVAADRSKRERSAVELR